MLIASLFREEALRPAEFDSVVLVAMIVVVLVVLMVVVVILCDLLEWLNVEAREEEGRVTRRL